MTMISGLTNIISVVLLLAGALFFLAGTVGLLRFPDIYTRIHALTKADNVGLGLIVLALAVQASSAWVALKLILIWLLILLASSTTGHLVARAALRNGIRPWTRR
jgi:multicomponent Na+:H+ antiporter subunit G